MKPDIEINQMPNGGEEAVAVDTEDKKATELSNGIGNEKRRCSSKAFRVLFGATLSNYVVALQWTAYGLYYVRLTDYFDVSKATAGWPGSLCIAVSCVSGLFLTPAIEKIHARWTSVVCGLMMFVGMILSATAASIWFLIFTYGLIAGFGLGGTMICSVVEVQQTFKRHRPFAQGVSFLGYSASNVLSPIIMFNLIETFGWRGAMLIHASIVLHATPGGLLFRRTSEIVYAKLKSAIKADAAKNNFETTKNNEIAEKSEQKNSDDVKIVVIASKSSNALDVIKQMFDFSALKDSRLLLYSLAMLVHRACTAVFLLNIPSRAVFVGLTFAQGAYLVSSYSVGNMSGRIVITFVSNMKCINLTLLVGVCMAGAGLSASFMSLWASFYISMTLCFCLGIFQGSVNTLMPSVLSDLFGSDRIARLQAITSAFGALPVLVMPPLAGYIFTVTQSYIVPYLIFGFIEVSGSLFLFAIYFLHRRYLRRSANSN